MFTRPRPPRVRALLYAGLAGVLACLASATAAAAGPRAYVLSGNALYAIDITNPPVAAPPVAVIGLTAGDTLVGIDFRPQNGHLYGLGFNSGAGTVTLYHISHRTGVATAIGTSGTFVLADGATPVPIVGPAFAFDVNPAADRLRV